MPQPDKEGKMGWGREEDADNPRRSIYIEKVEQELNLKLYGEAKFSEPEAAESLSDPILEILQELAPFDRGFDFTLVEKLVYGRELTRGPQNIGNCVGYSHAICLADSLALQVLRGDPEELLGDYEIEGDTPVPYIPYSYGAGRCLSGRMCGRGDGSYCAVQLRASQDHGFLPCSTEGLTGPFPQSSASVGRKFGSSKALCEQWRPKALAFDLLHSYSVNSEEKAWKAITEDYQPFQICSGWGFRARDKVTANGMEFWHYTRSGRWAHSMSVVAAFEINGKRWYKVSNQWGNTHKDGYWFVVSAETMAAWTRDADARTIGDMKVQPHTPDFSVI